MTPEAFDASEANATSEKRKLSWGTEFVIYVSTGFIVGESVPLPWYEQGAIAFGAAFLAIKGTEHVINSVYPGRTRNNETRQQGSDTVE